jgi:hypothetical protein
MKPPSGDSRTTNCNRRSPIVAPAWYGLRNKARKIQQLQAQYNAEYSADGKDCVDMETGDSSRLLTGKKLSDEEIATLATRRKEREARCKPQAPSATQASLSPCLPCFSPYRPFPCRPAMSLLLRVFAEHESCSLQLL